MGAVLLTLAIIFTQLSLIAFGGGNTILPEMQRQVVDIHHWMTAQEFSALFAMAQAAWSEHDDCTFGGMACSRVVRSSCDFYR